MEENKLSCIDCGKLECKKQEENYPDFCLTAHLKEGQLEETMSLYLEEENSRIAVKSAEVEGAFYGKMTRLEEIMEFARRTGMKKLGIATCIGLIEESRIVAKVFRAAGFEVYGVCCKVGSVDKTEIGIGEEFVRNPGEKMCNPILQAKLLNQAKTDLNVVIGLCVGHDSLFYKYSDALCTTLITKDRVLGHNPAAAIYMAKGYYKDKLFPKK